MERRPLSLPPLDSETATVSIVMPLRNETAHLRQTLASVLAQTFDRERMEIVAVDGESGDGTWDLLAEYERTCPRFRAIKNPRRTAPTALNLGITETASDVVVRVDGHCVLAPTYVERCVHHLAGSGAANVGGLMRPVGESLVGRAIARAMRSRFGIGNARFHYLEREEYVDTVYLGAFRRQALEAVGGYDESLTRNQDDELNYRLRRAGYGVLLCPDIISTYTPRGSLRSLWRQFYQYGRWKVRVMRKHPGSGQLRHLAPMSLVLILGTSIAASAALRRRRALLPAALYGLADVVAAVSEARSDPAAVLLLPAVFPCLHLSYGLGFLHGLLDLARDRLVRQPEANDSSRNGTS